MSVVATVMRELIALGVSGDALVAAVDRIAAVVETERVRSVEEAVEKASAKADRELAERKSKAIERTRKWREAQAANKAVISPNVTERHAASRNVTPPCERTQVVTPSLPSLRSEELKNPPEKPTVSTPKGANARGSRLPDNWRPMPFVVEAGGQALNGDDWGAELDKFRDYWRAVPGAKGLKLDWDATWRNWLRRAAENSTRKAPHERPHRDPKFEARQANLAAAFRGADSAARRHRES